MSAINNSKNRKKKNNKKKNKKQGGTPADSTTPSEISSPALTDNENLIVEESATASALPAPPIQTAGDGESNPTSNVSAGGPVGSLTGNENLIVEESATASALPAPPIQPAGDGESTPTSKIPAGGPVGVGAAGAGATAAAVAVAARKSISHASSSLPEQLPLSDNVKHCIKTVVASGSIDTLSIVKTIVKNVEAGDYKAKAALPPTAKAAPVIATPPKDTPTKAAAAPPTTNETSKSDKVKKAVAGAGAAVAGAGAAAVGAVKGNNKGGDKGGENVAVGADKSNLSENVQYCIQSVVQAPSVNVYGILDAANPNKVKCPEPAVGGSTQPAMPSSAKTADAAGTAVPPKVNEAHTKKSKEHRKSGLAALKKKNCIIL